MNPMKVFAALGEAGMVVTDSPGIAKMVRALRYHGAPDRVNSRYVSFNGRLDTLQAAILLKRLAYQNRFVKHRRAAARYYSENLKGVVTTPRDEKNYFDIYYTYMIRAARRDALKEFLATRGIESRVHHPLLMPGHQTFRNNGRGSWPVGTRLIRESLCLPIHEKISRAEQDAVISAVTDFTNGSG